VKAAESNLHAGYQCSLPLAARRGEAVLSAPRLLQASRPRGKGANGEPSASLSSMRCSREEGARVHIVECRRAGLRRGEGPGAPPSRPIAGTNGDPGAQPPAISVAIPPAGSSSGGVAASVRAAQMACEVAE